MKIEIDYYFAIILFSLMDIKIHPIGPVVTNCYVFGNSKEAIMLDPGGPQAVDIAKSLVSSGVEIKHILVTHGHFDHLSFATEVKKVLKDAKIYLHKEEKPYYESYHAWMSNYGMQPTKLDEPDVWMGENTLDLAGFKIDVIHTPGHTPGSVVFDIIGENTAFVGDLLFKGSIGRTDFPFCDTEKMQQSLARVMELDDDTRIYPGHNETTIMGQEKKENAFLLAIQRGIPIF